MCFQFGRRVPHGRLTFNVYHLNTLNIFLTHIRPLTRPKDVHTPSLPAQFYDGPLCSNP